MLKQQFEHRLNKVICHPALVTELFEGEVDFHVLSMLDELVNS